MAGIFGALNVNDRDRVFSATVGQRVIYDTAMQWMMDRNAELEAALGVFVQETTEEYKRRFKLPGSGYLQRRNVDGRYQAVKAQGQWDVAFPLEDMGAAIAGNDVDMRYMTIGELDLHLTTVWSQNVNTVRFEMLRAMMNNTQRPFIDPDWGTLNVEPLANGDAVVYPPVLGSDTEAVENHYIETNYAPASISDTNDPLTTIKNDLEEHFDVNPAGSDIVVFSASDSVPYVKGLTGFTEVSDRFITKGDDSDELAGLPSAHPGTLIGRAKGVWYVEWRHLPSTYMIGIHTGQPAPLTKRKDPADTGLNPFLELVAKDMTFPFTDSFWRHRFGFGVGNRLNGIVLELATGGTYTIPTIYQ